MSIQNRRRYSWADHEINIGPIATKSKGAFWLSNHRETKDNQESSGHSSQRTGRCRGGVVLAVPTLNAEAWLPKWITALNQQKLQPSRVIVVDSESTDRTVELAREAGLEVVSILRSEFSHGGTRQAVVNQLDDCEIVIFLTQDALLSGPDSLESLLVAFDDKNVGAAYGRQLPRIGASAIEAHARLFNYPDESHVRGEADVEKWGIKTSFISNSFAAWRVKALNEVGGFPDHTIQNEDAWVASRMIQAGWKVAYRAEANVHHSHDLSVMQEFKRYFDTGVFHAQAPWIREAFGGASGEGARFVRSEIGHLAEEKPLLIGNAIVRTGAKYVGFKLGSHERLIPKWIKSRISSNRGYWQQKHDHQGQTV